MKERKRKGRGEDTDKTTEIRAGSDPFQRLLGLMFKAHPWHGVSIGDEAPDVVTAYIEIVPTDTVKYEVDKNSGFLKVDRPQRFSNCCPVYYGLIPQTYSGDQVAGIFAKRARRKGMVGDGDPLDICVLSEKSIPHSDILLTALPIGGLSMADGGEADDKIIAVMRDDAVYGGFTDISQCPSALMDRLQHYFLTYKSAPGTTHHKVEITSVYGREEARKVIRASHADYRAKYPELGSLWPKNL
ncbi:MAG: inorganic pyrophosphatase [Nitrospira sp. CG24B]|nr:MAG: inorganic pyrophosphatase [Nitrospira sp. CG24B]